MSSIKKEISTIKITLTRKAQSYKVLLLAVPLWILGVILAWVNTLYAITFIGYYYTNNIFLIYFNISIVKYILQPDYVRYWLEGIKFIKLHPPSSPILAFIFMMVIFPVISSALSIIGLVLSIKDAIGLKLMGERWIEREETIRIGIRGKINSKNFEIITKVKNIVKDAIKSADWKLPLEVCIVVSNTRNATSTSYGLFKMRHRITLTTGLIEYLSEKELEAVVCHELYHLKHNTKITMILNIISSALLVGRGTLTAALGLAVDELKADEFAARCTAPEYVIEYLKKLKPKSEDQSNKKDSGLFKHLIKVKQSFKAFIDLWINPYPTYFHPPIELRIEYINLLAKP